MASVGPNLVLGLLAALIMSCMDQKPPFGPEGSPPCPQPSENSATLDVGQEDYDVDSDLSVATVEDWNGARRGGGVLSGTLAFGRERCDGGACREYVVAFTVCMAESSACDRPAIVVGTCGRKPLVLQPDGVFRIDPVGRGLVRDYGKSVQDVSAGSFDMATTIAGRFDGDRLLMTTAVADPYDGTVVRASLTANKRRP